MYLTDPQLFLGEAAATAHQVWVAREVADLYQGARRRARWMRLWNGLRRRPARLSDLAAVARRPAAAAYGGIQLVPVGQIRGSEGRAEDFDSGWRPTRPHDRPRWLGVAAAWQLGCPLPPVVLIQVGDTYFVRDGHHRVSVAVALGARQIEAEVTVWSAAAAPATGRPASMLAPARAECG